MDARQRIIEATYACVARRGMAKTTVEDVAREAGISRATVYRAFPGGRDELVDATVSWAVFDFFAKLYDRIQGATDLEEVMERGIMFAHRSIVEHEVLQRVMQTEPDKLLPALTVESNRIREGIAEVLAPFVVDRGLAPGVDLADAADFLARMVLSYISAPGRWDLEDPDQVARLVRFELLAGVVVPAAALSGVVPWAAGPGSESEAGVGGIGPRTPAPDASGRVDGEPNAWASGPDVARSAVGRRAVDGETNRDLPFQRGSAQGELRVVDTVVPFVAPTTAESPHRVRIIDGTLACLARHGTAKTTVDDIARESGVSRATVYRAFPGGRDEILGAVVDTEMARLFSALGVRLGNAGDLTTALVGGIVEASTRLRDHAALHFLVEHEPGMILGHLAFDESDRLLVTASRFTAPFLARWMSPDEAERVAEWAARIVLSYAIAPSDHLDLVRRGGRHPARHHLHAPGDRGAPERLDGTDRHHPVPGGRIPSRRGPRHGTGGGHRRRPR